MLCVFYSCSHLFMKLFRRILVAGLVLSSLLWSSAAMAAQVKVRTAMDVLKNMVDASNTVNSGEYQTVFKMTSKTPKYEAVPAKKNDPNDPFGLGEMKMVGTKTTNYNLYLSVKADQTGKTMSIGAHLDIKEGKDKPIVIEGEARLFDSTLYFKLNKLDIPATAAAAADEWKKYERFVGQWLRLDDETLMKQLQGSQKYGIGASLWQTKRQLSAQEEETVKYVMDLITRHKVLAITVLRSQVISGQPTYHYSIALNKRGLANALAEAQIKYSGDLSSYSSLNVVKSEKQLRADNFKTIQKIQMPTLEVWIGKKDFVLYKYNFRYTLSLQQLLKTPFSFVMTLSNTMKSVNQPVSIEVPADARDLEEYAEDVLGPERRTSRDKERLADLRTMQTALELYYQDKGTYPIAKDGIYLAEGDAMCLRGNGFTAQCEYSSYDEATGTYTYDPIYMSRFPKDPAKDGSYWYISQDGTTYSIKTDLEEGVNDLPRGQIVAQPSGIKSTNPR